MDKKYADTIAAIDIGSSYIRLIIAEMKMDGSLNLLEDLNVPTEIGRDTFGSGRINVESIHDTCEALTGFVRVMREYGVNRCRTLATTGIREAENQEYVLEQIRLRTGLSVRVINNAEERFLTYKALRESIPEAVSMRQEGIVVLNIGMGGVEVSVFWQGNLRYTEYIKIGSLRLREILGELERQTLDFSSVLEEYVESKVYLLDPQIRELKIKNFIGLGGQLDTIYRLTGGGKKEVQPRVIKKAALSRLHGKLRNMSTDQIMQDLGVNRNEAESLLPSVIIFLRFIEMTEAACIHVPTTALRHGMLADMADEQVDTARKLDFMNDIISSVWFIGKKYNTDVSHSAHVEKLALSIFDQTKKIHRLGQREKLYLRIASILHDIGKYVNFDQHDIHSYNIICSQNILGFSDRELRLIANITRYHSDENPHPQHVNYRELEHDEKILVSKMAAILKLADSLDITHNQKVESITISSGEQEVYFRIRSSEDLLLEEWSFADKALFFEEVMGYRPVIKRKK
ncbi:MAG: HD domain-containing protein [Acidobacteriota bacterium]